MLAFLKKSYDKPKFSVTRSCPTLCDPMDCSTPGFPVPQNLLKLELVMPFNHLIFYHPFLILPSIFPSIWVFSSESDFCIRWPKYWSFSISAFNEYSGLISFRIVWFDLLVDQGTLKSLIQHHRSKASILEKQRHCFAKNGLCSQSYDFSGGLVWM